jgi:hypothetical protein
MIEKGTKVVCIKDYYCTNGNFIWSFTKGKIYEVLSVGPEYTFVYIKCNFTQAYFKGKIFKFGSNNRNNNLNLFKDYFITLAEWRQQQIDKILEDE